MRLFTWLFCIVISLATIRGVHAQDSSGSAEGLACMATQTFYPRGDHIPLAPGGIVKVSYTTDSNFGEFNKAVQRAFTTWSSTSCSAGVVNINFVVGPSYSPQASVNTSVTNLNNTVYWFENNFPESSALLAYTQTYYESLFNADVVSFINFNLVNYEFRTNNGLKSYGCSSYNSNCYDVETVALHEIGHFIGLNHVLCSDATMFPYQETNTAEATNISTHEIGAACALYPPATTTGANNRSMGESCNNANCASGLACATDSVYPQGAWCVQGCAPANNSNDCPVGWVCNSVNLASENANICMPGVHLAGVSVATATANTDLCQPCYGDGTTCTSNECVTLGDGNSYCSQLCGSPPSYACPAGFICSTLTVSTNNTSENLCVPPTENGCITYYQGAALNDVCSGTSAGGTSVSLTCAAGLVCVATSATEDDCLQECDNITTFCSTGSTCCFGLDSSGDCITNSETTTTGACFVNSQPGDACYLPDQSLCASGSTCFYTDGVPADAACYRNCTNGTGCAATETCVGNTFQDQNGNVYNICCLTSSYNPNDISTCVPQPAPCLRQVGVTCQNNTDCLSNLCQQNGNKFACSTTCVSNSDCPGVNADVNSDGTPDGGCSCIPISGENVCWPNKAPASIPACAVISSTTSSGKSSCGGCSQTTSSDTCFVVFIALWYMIRRMRYKYSPSKCAWLVAICGYLCAASVAHATTVKSLTEAEMAQLADTIFVGQVTQNITYRYAGGPIRTRTYMKVLQRIKGTKVGSTVRLDVPGGTYKNIKSHVEGAPTFALHEQVLVFCETRGIDCVPTGFSHGIYRLFKSRQGIMHARHFQHGTAFAPEPLSDILQRIEGYIH